MALLEEAKKQIGGDVLKTSEAAKKINYAYTGLMKLIYTGTKAGKLKYIQRGKRFYVRESDLKHYPFMSTHGVARHYDDNWEPYTCPECSSYYNFGVGKPCEVATVQ